MEGADIIPANIERQEFEHDTARFMRSAEGGAAFFNRMGSALREIDGDYDVAVIDCPPQLGFLTLSALCAATAAIITVHPQMLDVASMSQFLAMKGQLLQVIENSGGVLRLIGSVFSSPVTNQTMVLKRKLSPFLEVCSEGAS